MANFQFSDARLVKTGIFTLTAGTFQAFQSGPDARLDFLFFGTQFDFQYQATQNNLIEIIVDGSASTPATTGDNTIRTLSMSGYSDTWHRGTIRSLDSVVYAANISSTMLTIHSAGTPQIATPDSSLTFARQPDLSGTFYAFRDSAFATAAAINQGFHNEFNSNSDVIAASWSDSVVTFKILTTTGVPWSLVGYYSDGSNLRKTRVFIDGVSAALITDTVLFTYDYQIYASGTGDGLGHIVEFVKCDTDPSDWSYNYGFMLNGATQDQTWVPPVQDTLANYSDSIFASVTTNERDSTVGPVWKLGHIRNMAIANRGIGGTLVQGSGDTRTVDITGLSPQPSICLIPYGTNDMAAGGGSSGTGPNSGFSSSYQTMLNDLLAGTTSTIFYVIGIIPRQGFLDATIALWNGSGNGIQGSIATVVSATPAYASRIIYVDPSGWGLVPGGDYTVYYWTSAQDGQGGLHLNDAGGTLVAGKLQAFISPTTSTTLLPCFLGRFGMFSGILSSVAVAISLYFRPDGTSKYLRPDGTSLYYRP